ncbi:hypothetical protein CEV08_03990 [Bartonella tribocorum]|uniref:Uncharacterized protein n=1 Tax=Bartonella tribocorum TaxID=85701 RepID=A0A2M6UW51_9HYPH|nr:hypothetical protein CEV08_03990 [Bartonella tribocorum]
MLLYKLIDYIITRYFKNVRSTVSLVENIHWGGYVLKNQKFHLLFRLFALYTTEEIINYIATTIIGKTHFGQNKIPKTNDETGPLC